MVRPSICIGLELLQMYETLPSLWYRPAQYAVTFNCPKLTTEDLWLQPISAVGFRKSATVTITSLSDGYLHRLSIQLIFHLKLPYESLYYLHILIKSVHITLCSGIRISCCTHILIYISVKKNCKTKVQWIQNIIFYTEKLTLLQLPSFDLCLDGLYR